MRKILTIGEPLGMLCAATQGELRNVDTFKRYVAGAELTYAVGMARLGYDVTYVTKVGNDPMGLHILDFLQKEKVNTEFLDIVENYSTGIEMKRSNEDGWPDLYYFRGKTAAQLLSPKDIKRINFDEYDHLHVTGISIALSQSCREAVMEMISKAHAHDITVSFDPNLRPRLWPNEDEMRYVLNGITILCDIVFPELLEAQKLLGTSDPDTIADFYISAGVKTVVLKMGDRGIFVKNKKERFFADDYPYTNIVDRMGIGEGFAVGITSALLEGRTLEHAIARGRIIGAHIATDTTTYGSMPNRETLIAWIKEVFYNDETVMRLYGEHIPDKELPEETPLDAATNRQFIKEQLATVEMDAEPKDDLDKFLMKQKALDEEKRLEEAKLKTESLHKKNTDKSKKDAKADMGKE